MANREHFTIFTDEQLVLHYQQHHKQKALAVNKQLANLIDPYNKHWFLKDRLGNKIDTLATQLFVNKKQYIS